MKIVLSLMVIFANALVQRAMSQDLDVERTLIGAQALYQKAHYKDSVDYLLPVDAMLREQPGRVGQAISVKMQLALGYVGQNQFDKAKSLLQEVCILDPEYKLEPNQFAPKVLALYNEVTTERKRAKCEALCQENNRLSKSGDAEGLLALTKDLGDGCICQATTEAAEVLYRQGVAAY